MDEQKLHREVCFGSESKPRSGYVWCLHCERAYEYGKFRSVTSIWSEKDIEWIARHSNRMSEREKESLREPMQMCPYPDCDGDAVLDAWNWDDFRKTHPDCPEVPVIGEVYPLYE